MKKLLSLTLILAIAAASQAGNVVVVNGPKQPVPVTTVASIGGTALTTTTAYSTHATTNATATVTSATAYVYTVQVVVSNAGSAWTITVRSKEATPKILYTATAVAGSFTPVDVQVPIGVTSGIDIITAGTTPGVADIWITYQQ